MNKSGGYFLKNLVDKIIESKISKIVSYEFPENELVHLNLHLASFF